MDIFIERQGKKVSVPFSGKGKSLLAKLGINPETVLIVKNKAVVPDDEELGEGDEVELLSVISGG